MSSYAYNAMKQDAINALNGSYKLENDGHLWLVTISYTHHRHPIANICHHPDCPCFLRNEDDRNK
jgi:hypothetical protein